MPPALCVVIPNWNGLNYIGACLHSLQKQTLRDFEVIVVDNGSSDGSADLVRQLFSWARVISLGGNRGFAAASNVGAANATSEHIALLNNDTEADPSWAAALVDYLAQNPEVGFCASKVLLHSRPDLVDSCGDYYSVEGVAGKIGHLELASGFSHPREIFGASACASIYRRDLLQEVHGFDEDFFLAHEDTDLSFRARLMGHSCHFVPAAVVRHHVGGTLGYRSPLAEYYASRNQEYVLIKNMPSRLLIKYSVLHAIAVAMQLAAHTLRGRSLPLLRGKRDALRALPQLLRKRRQVQREARIPPEAIDRILMRGWMRQRTARKLSGAEAKHSS